MSAKGPGFWGSPVLKNPIVLTLGGEERLGGANTDPTLAQADSWRRKDISIAFGTKNGGNREQEGGRYDRARLLGAAAVAFKWFAGASQ